MRNNFKIKEGSSNLKLCSGNGSTLLKLEERKFNSNIYKHYREILSETKEKAFAVGKGENEGCGA